MPQPLDSRQLRAFATLARTGSFTRTAHELHLTQSAISHAIKALEEDLACRLFDRMGKAVVLTQAGEQLLVRAQKILEEMNAARSELAQLGKWGSSRLRIGASTTACQYILPAVLREFKESFPRCAISIEPDDTPEAIEALRAHRIDLAVNLEPRRGESLEFRPLFTDELRFIVSPFHPWAQAGKVSRDDIAQQHYILYGKGKLHRANDRGVFSGGQNRPAQFARSWKHGGDQGTREAWPRHQHHRAVDGEKGNRGRVAGRVATGPPQAQASLGHSALAGSPTQSC
jgi:DNA-binding transcriptional LysR family regulator